MLISSTPLRVSLVGGGTDYPDYIRRFGGVVVGAAVTQSVYFMVRRLPDFHEYRTRVIYKEIETITDLSQLRHQAAKTVIESAGMGDVGLEVFYSSDVPARCGLGSSSAFVVGLLHSLNAMRGKLLSKQELSDKANYIERAVLKEAGGLQDPLWSSFGGINAVKFHPSGEISVQPLLLSKSHVEEMESHLLLMFTRVTRSSAEVANTYKLKDEDLHAMKSLAEQSMGAIYTRDWLRLGNLIDMSWRIKMGFSNAVSNQDIDKMYMAARLNGAYGGKICGAGGGGCLLLVAPPERQQEIVSTLTEEFGCVQIPVKFDFDGSKIIFADRGAIASD